MPRPKRLTARLNVHFTPFDVAALGAVLKPGETAADLVRVAVQKEVLARLKEREEA